MIASGAVPAPVPASPYPAGSSEWWIARLSRALYARQARFRLLDSYYRGTNDTARLATAAYREAGLLELFPRLSANHSKLIVGAVAQRLVILGFRLGGELRADTEAGRIWQANNLDAFSEAAHVEALVKGECPILVEPNADDPTTPIVTPQNPEQMIVWYAPGDRRIRRAALKSWWDEEARRGRYVLYLPDRIETWQDRQQGQLDPFLRSLFRPGQPRWEFVRGERNPLGEVPVVTLPNTARLEASPEAEHESILALNDLYNYLLMNMAHTAKELAFPQRYGTGVETVAAGETIRISPSDMLTAASPDAAFGQFVAATLDNYVKALDTVRADEATITLTPYHFLLNVPSSVPPSGDSITASDAAHVGKVRGHARVKGAPWRDVMRLCFRLAGDERRAIAMRDGGRVLWQDPENRSWSQHIDGLSKLAADPIGAPQEAVWEMVPMPPEEIARWKQMRAEQEPAGPVTAEQAMAVARAASGLPIA